MECKLFSVHIFTQGKCELIDTLWNVNATPGSLVLDWNLELIDTVWNVNLICYFRYLAQF